MGPDDKMKDIGYWENLDKNTDKGLVMSTCLCALQLEVYYRYLPTYKPPVELEEEEDAGSDNDVDINIDI